MPTTPVSDRPPNGPSGALGAWQTLGHPRDDRGRWTAASADYSQYLGRVSPLLNAWIYEYTQRALDAKGSDAKRRGLYECVGRLGELAGGLSPSLAVQVAASHHGWSLTGQR